MIFSIIGTDIKKRNKAFAEVLKGKDISSHIYSNNIYMLEPLISAQDIFGGEVVVVMEQTMEKARGDEESNKEIVKKLLPAISESKNIFIIDEPFADVFTVRNLEKYSKEVFDCREEKIKERNAFVLCDAIDKRDRKQAFVEWMKIKDLTPEMVHGAIWWKVRTIWEIILQGGSAKYSLDEIELMGKKLIDMSHDAHRGETDLKRGIEKLVLGI